MNVNIPLRERYADAVLIELFFHLPRDVPVNRPVVARLDPGATDEVHGRIGQFVHANHRFRGPEHQRMIFLRDRPGESFVAFRHHAADPSTLSSDGVISIYQDRGGVLWLGTLDGGVNKVAVELRGIGEDLHVPITVAALRGALARSHGESVNFVNAERVAAGTETARRAAHERKNPLAAVRAFQAAFPPGEDSVSLVAAAVDAWTGGQRQDDISILAFERER